MESEIFQIRPENPDVISCFIKKPANFNFLPGQFIDIEIEVKDCDERCNKRTFSLSSSPTEKYLMITTRRGVSKCKHTLENSVGKKIIVKGPYGKFVLNEDNSIPAAFITGGIGITPLRSMIKYATDKKLKKKITLVYSNKNSQDITFKKELDAWSQKNPNLTIIYTITAYENNWTGKTGRIDEKMIRELVSNLDNTEFYIVGPAQMVLDMKKMLKDLGIEEVKIKFELFTGY